VELVDAAMATSGSYLQQHRVGDQRVHHIIDPRTGRNPTVAVVSVTVIAATCELADGLATAMMVLGPDAGREVLGRFPGVHALFLQPGADGRMERVAYDWKE
jgi:thiamine biosynthesis lipoprotein